MIRNCANVNAILHNLNLTVHIGPQILSHNDFSTYQRKLSQLGKRGCSKKIQYLKLRSEKSSNVDLKYAGLSVFYYVSRF